MLWAAAEGPAALMVIIQLQFYGLEAIAADAKGDLYVCDVDRSDGNPGRIKNKKRCIGRECSYRCRGSIANDIYMVPSPGDRCNRCHLMSDRFLYP